MSDEAKTNTPEPTTADESKMVVTETPGDCVIAARVSENLTVFITDGGAANEVRNAKRFTRASGAKALKAARETYPNAEVLPASRFE